MPNEKPGILRNLRVKRVSLVDMGANFDTGTGDGAHIMLYKAATKKDGPGLGSVHVDAPLAADRKRKKKPAYKEKNVKKSMLKSFLGLFAETDAEKRNAGIVELTKALDDNDEDDNVAKTHTPDDAMCKCADCMVKDTNKRFSGELSKAVTALEKKHAEEVAILKASVAASAAAVEVEKNQRLDREMVDILKSFKATPFNFDTDVAKFRKMKEASPEAFERTMEVLKAQDAQIAAGDLFKNVGSSRSGGQGDAWTQIEAKADALVEKSTDLTREKAIEKVLLNPANKALVKLYREQQQ